MGCRACERRRKALAKRRADAKARGRKVEAAAIGAVLAVSDAINGEVEDDDSNGSDLQDSRGNRASG